MIKQKIVTVGVLGILFLNTFSPILVYGSELEKTDAVSPTEETTGSKVGETTNSNITDTEEVDHSAAPEAGMDRVI